MLAIRDGTSIIYSLNLSVVEDALLGLLARLQPIGDAARDADRAAKEPRHE